ncbi:MAG TPA: phospholipase [Devosiaceae bacterium]
MLGPVRGDAPARLVVLLHGYGSDGNDLIALAPYWRNLLPDALFVAPNAPDRCAINPAGFQWFPIDQERWETRSEGILQAGHALDNFLDVLWAQTGLGPSRTILAGFSQGAMMALHTGLRLAEPAMGIIAFSGALLRPESLGAELRSRPPVCLVHGDADPVVAVTESTSAERVLAGLGLDVRLKVCGGEGHTIPQEGFEFASLFVAEIAAGDGH